MALAMIAGPVAPHAARAEDQLALAWGTCRLAGGASNVTVNCGDLFASNTLVCSFQSAVPVDSVIGAELVLDIRTSVTPVPAYWQFGVGGCNISQLTPSFPAPGACADPWGGFGSALVTDVIPGVPGGASSERIIVVVTVPAVQARTLDAGTVYQVVQLVLGNGRPCSGCLDPACLVLNSVRLLRLPGAADVMISGAGSAPDNFATWQGGTGADCQSVPARTPSWGTLKVLYR